MLHLNFLGAPFVTFAEQPVTAVNNAPALLRLFAFLVMQPRPHARTVLAGTFWPELAEAHARRTLNNLFWRLRTALPQGDTLFQVNQQTIHFQPQQAYWLDVQAFDQQTQALAHKMAHAHGPLDATGLAEYAAALALYRADFLEGMDDAWCLPLRAQWRERYLTVLERYSVRCEESQQIEQALQAAQTLVALEPFREYGHQRLIELELALGRHAEAAGHFAQYEQIWRTELHLPPSAELSALAARHQLRPGVTSASPRQPLVNPAPDAILSDHPEYLRRQLDICFQNDDLYDLMADRPRQRENLLLAQTLATKLAEPQAQIETLARRTWLATRHGDYAEALDLAQTGLALCTQTRQEEQRAWLHRLIGVTNEEMGNFNAALHHYTKALQVDEAHNVTTFLAANLNNVAATQLTLAHYWPAIQALERAQSWLVRQPAPRMAVMVVGNLGYAWLKLGQFAQADRYLQQALTLTHRLGDRSTEWWLGAVLARLYHRRGETSRGLTFALQQYSAARTAGDARLQTYLADTLALLYGDQQDGAASLQWAQWMQEHAAQKQQWRYQMRSWLRLAQAQYLLGEHATAFSSVERAVAHYVRKKEILEDAPELFATYARCAAAVGKQQLADEAQRQAQQALHIQMGELPDLALRQSFLRVQHFPQI